MPGRLSMSFDTVPVTVPVILDANLCLPWVATKCLYDVLAPKIKLDAANLRRDPNPGLKLVTDYFSRKEIVR